MSNQNICVAVLKPPSASFCLYTENNTKHFTCDSIFGGIETKRTLKLILIISFRNNIHCTKNTQKCTPKCVKQRSNVIFFFEKNKILMVKWIPTKFPDSRCVTKKIAMIKLTKIWTYSSSQFQKVEKHLKNTN